MVKVEKRSDKGWNWENGMVRVEEVLRTDVGNGTVYIFRIEVDDRHPVRVDIGQNRVYKMCNSFYVATYSSKDEPDKIWGFGELPEEALMDAIKNRDKEELARVKEDETKRYFNPFLKAVKPLKEKVREEVKGVLELVVDEGEKITKEDLEDGELLIENAHYLTGRTVGVLDIEPELFISLRDGTVGVYRISDPLIEGNKVNLPVYFYIVTLEFKDIEEVWGVGKTVNEALEDAVKEWDELTGGYANPFRKAIKAVEEDTLRNR
jgi:predicted RNase H-like HicB family nuclease